MSPGSSARPLPTVIVAAAGRGTRYLADHPKVLADVGGRPALVRVIEAIETGLGPHRQLLVVGNDGDAVRASLPEAGHRTFVVQREPRGTGDALRTALAALDGEPLGPVYFFCGDKPLLRAATVARFAREFAESDAAMMFLTGRLEGDPTASRQGRVLTVGDEALAILERKVLDAHAEGLTLRLGDGRQRHWTQAELLALRRVNVSTYAWQAKPLRAVLGSLAEDPDQREVLVTDLVALLRANGARVACCELADPREGLGVDTLAQLALVQATVTSLEEQPTP